MNDVNREQAHLKGAVAQEQAFEAKSLVDKEIQKDTSVNPGADEGDMDNRIKDEKKGHEDEGKQNKGEKEEKNEDDHEDREYIKDPNLGQNIDLIG